MADLIKGMLAQRRSRAVAEVMGALEGTPAWRALIPEEQRNLRSAVMRGVNGYHDVALDLLKVLSDDHVLINEQAVRMIEDLHRDSARRR